MLTSLLALLLMCTAVFSATQLDSKVVIQPIDAQQLGTSESVALVVFNPGSVQNSAQENALFQKFYSACKLNFPSQCVVNGYQDFNCCMTYQATQDMQTTSSTASQNAKMSISYLPSAHFSFKYFNTVTNTWTEIPNCQESNVVATSQGTSYTPSNIAGQPPVTITYWFAKCDIPSAIYSGQSHTWVRVTYVPHDGDAAAIPGAPPGATIKPSTAEYTIETAKIAPADQITLQIYNMVQGTAQSSASQEICFGLFLLMGVLLASLYFTGKSPISLLDITTPRLPSPKGPVASGQIIAPFGYTEMKSTINKKMDDVRKAAGMLAANSLKNAALNSNYQELSKAMRNAKMSAAEKASGKADRDSAMQDVIIKGGIMLGKSKDELMDLALIRPEKYRDAQYKYIREQILNPLLAKGGREELLARSIDDYLKGRRVMDTLLVLTAHPEVTQQSAMHYTLSNTVGKFLGVNRYTQVGGLVSGTIDSGFRSARAGGRMVKGIVTEAPQMARGIGRTIVDLKPGRMAALESRAKTSSVAAWAVRQMNTNPSNIEIGHMFPVHDKMSHLYTTLRDEALNDQMRYVLRQWYKKANIRSDIGEAELADLGVKNIDILKRINYNSSVHSIDQEVERILSDHTKSISEKLAALTNAAKAHGAYIDSRADFVSNKLEGIEKMAIPDYIKMIHIQEALETENNRRIASSHGDKNADNAYYSHVGGDTPRGSMIWESLVFRQMVKDKEDGYKGGGIREYAMMGTLEAANRIATLAPSTGTQHLPEHMRNIGELQLVEERNRQYLKSLFTEEYAREFQSLKGKSINSASIAELVAFSLGAGKLPVSGEVDKRTGAMAWWGGGSAYKGTEPEHEMPKNATLLDIKRFWSPEIKARENFALGQWVQSRFEKGHITPFKASLEAELDKLSAAGNWSVERRGLEAKKLWIADLLRQDMESRFNSLYGQNTYGTTKETMRFYNGVMAGFLEQAMKNKGLESNHESMRFIEQLDMTNPKQLARLKNLLGEHHQAFEDVISKPVTYDQIAKSNKAMVSMYEGGFAYYKKGMLLADSDRIIGGSLALKDNKGQLRAFAPEDVQVKFANRDDLAAEYGRVGQVKDPKEWDSFVNRVKSWAKEGGYDYDREKVLAAVLWHCGTTTYDYSRYWHEAAVSVEAKRQVTPLAPSTLRFFGVDAPQLTTILKPFRDIALHMGDYISKVSLLAGGHMLRTSYDITPLSELYRQRSRELVADIGSGKYTKYLNKDEQVAFNQLAADHWRFHQVWDYAIDRHPAKASSSYGSSATFAAGFNMGPAVPYKVRDNLRAYLSKGEFTNFMALYGFPMDLAGRMLMPYQSMVRGMQMAMQGYPSKWDMTGDPMRMWDHTAPRFSEWMQSFNPFSFSWFGGKTSDRIRKLNYWGGSMERSQLAGSDFIRGLQQGPADLLHSRKGIFANLRTYDCNPGASAYNYRNTLILDSPMAEYLYRMKEGAFYHDAGVRKAALDNTTRRTISAEALAARREGELRNFGIMSNPIYGWASPLTFLLHLPLPFMPPSWTPKDIMSKWAMRAKGGHGQPFTESMRSFAERSAAGINRFFRPDMRDRMISCPKCGIMNQRGVRCKNPTCGVRLYGS